MGVSEPNLSFKKSLQNSLGCTHTQCFSTVCVALCAFAEHDCAKVVALCTSANNVPGTAACLQSPQYIFIDTWGQPCQNGGMFHYYAEPGGGIRTTPREKGAYC